MKLTTSPFKSDVLTLTKSELKQIADGEELRVSALYIRLEEEPKPDVVVERMICVTVVDDDTYITLAISNYSNCRFVFDGETGKLKSAEVL